MEEAKILEFAASACMAPARKGSIEHYFTRDELLAFARLVAAAERERAARIVLDDMMAATYQTMGQYRTGLAYHIMGVDRPASAIRSRTE